MSGTTVAVAVEVIASRIVVLRGQRVMLDADLAALYGVETRRLNEQVRRNAERFPADFMIALTQAEWEVLRSHIATLKTGRGQHRKYLPHAFTEHGAIMAATVLNSPHAVEISVYVVRALASAPFQRNRCCYDRASHTLMQAQYRVQKSGATSR